MNEAVAHAFFARREEKIEEAEVKAEVDLTHPPGVLVDAILDEVKDRIMLIMEKGQVFAACVPLKLKEYVGGDAGHPLRHSRRAPSR